jgi:predicted acylesterase/phospholipase RssA
MLGLSTAARALEPVNPSSRLGSALVLTGGGARGAYEAGVVEGLRRAANVGDGQRIPGIDIVCGTSIGSINAWFVATGQYSKLHGLWANIASDNPFALKKRYAATGKPGAFFGTKIVEGVSLAEGLTKNVSGVLDGNKIQAWLATHVDPRRPCIIPIAFTATNLDRDRTEIFYRTVTALPSATRDRGMERLWATVGDTTVARVATNEFLRTELQASAAVPILFDPIDLPSVNGGIDHFVDGGVSDNSPLDIARAMAHTVRLVLVSPQLPERKAYVNALQIGIRVDGIEANRMFDDSLRAAYDATREKRLFAHATLSAAERSYEAGVLDTDLFYMRPRHELAVNFIEFDDQSKINGAYDAGIADIADGWISYGPPPPRRAQT